VPKSTFSRAPFSDADSPSWPTRGSPCFPSTPGHDDARLLGQPARAALFPRGVRMGSRSNAFGPHGSGRRLRSGSIGAQRAEGNRRLSDARIVGRHRGRSPGLIFPYRTGFREMSGVRFKLGRRDLTLPLSGLVLILLARHGPEAENRSWTSSS